MIHKNKPNFAPKSDPELSAQFNKLNPSGRVGDVALAQEMAYASNEYRRKAARYRQVGEFIRDMNHYDRTEERQSMRANHEVMAELSQQGYANDTLVELEMNTLQVIQMTEASETRRGRRKTLDKLQAKADFNDYSGMQVEAQVLKKHDEKFNR